MQGAGPVRELESQIGSMLYERLAKSRDEAAIKALSSRGLIIEEPADAIKDPMVLEFLGLEDRSHWHELDLEQAIIDRLETFLLELGKGFCFVGQFLTTTGHVKSTPGFFALRNDSNDIPGQHIRTG